MSINRSIKKHIDGTILVKEELKEISNTYPDCIYTGPAFRCLIFNEEKETRGLTVVNDICFAGSLNGIKHFLNSVIRDDFIVVFEVEIEHGIDLVHLVQTLDDFLDHKELTTKEDEICAYSIKSESIFYTGRTSSFLERY